MKAAIRKAGCVVWIAPFIFLNLIRDASSQSTDSITVNENAVAFAAELIQKGHFIADGRGAWREHRPSADAENEFIRRHGFSEYAKWHLGVDERYPADTKRRYKFPYGDFTNVHRCGILAVEVRARQYGHTDMQGAAAQLLEMIAVKQR
jgi:hypothetical protein